MEVHFIAIGGSVMHQLAIALKRKEYVVSGSDDEIFEPSRTNLEKEGILPPLIGWFPEKIHSHLDAVILGMHAKEDNPELKRARELGLKIYSFPEYIYQESRNKTRAVIGGSHGKTTTTAMIMHVLQAAGLDFDYLVGARLEGFEQSVKVSNAPYIVCEGDEYPASTIEKRPKFHFLFPHIAVLTGIAWDHINVFPTFEGYLEQFSIFIDKIEPGGLLIFNEEDDELVKLINKARRSDIRYQPYTEPQHSISEGSTTISIETFSSSLQVFGKHNLLNLQAAFHVCKELGINAEAFSKHISGFKGAARRLEVLGKNNDRTVYRDFAHAPSKLKATLEAVRKQFPNRKLIAVFELHTYSSLSERFLKEYAGSMEMADSKVIYYSKHALELKRLPDLSTEQVKAGFGSDDVEVFNQPEVLIEWLTKQDYTNTNLLLMSSGNYDGLDISELARRISNKA
jgi:UDP-N-acetylmuramate: L-alanyl-gamma-D-glutamyl-meso-diaminopimelate ligase